MPSSSKRDTSQELRLVNLYHSIYVRLYYAGKHREASFISTQFAELLDCDVRDLMDTIFVDHYKWFQDWKFHAASKKDADLIWAAGSYMADAGACLFEFGRHEAPKYCGWADEIYGMVDARY